MHGAMIRRADIIRLHARFSTKLKALHILRKSKKDETILRNINAECEQIAVGTGHKVRALQEAKS